jgi:hypothetical protein
MKEDMLIKFRLKNSRARYHLGHLGADVTKPQGKIPLMILRWDVRT